jgi:hypothetical protein
LQALQEFVDDIRLLLRPAKHDRVKLDLRIASDDVIAET